MTRKLGPDTSSGSELAEGRFVRERIVAPLERAITRRLARPGTELDASALDAARDGDLCFFRGRHPLSTLIARISRGAHSHVGIFLRWDARLMLVHAGPAGVVVLPAERMVSSYDGCVERFELDPAVRSDAFVTRLRDVALAEVGAPFARVDLALLGLHYTLGTPLPMSNSVPADFVCSQYVAHCFARAGIDLVPEKAPAATTPNDLASSAFLARVAMLRGA